MAESCYSNGKSFCLKSCIAPNPVWSGVHSFGAAGEPGSVDVVAAQGHIELVQVAGHVFIARPL